MQNKPDNVDNLYAACLTAHKSYKVDNAPLSLFLVAFRRFYAAWSVERPPRYTRASEEIQAFSRRCRELEQDDDAAGVWRIWSNIRDKVSKYDKSRAALQIAPSRSIDDLLALGVPKRQIAQIYGFVDVSGVPDVSAVDRREKWRPQEPRKEHDAQQREISRLASAALSALESSGVALDDTTVAALESSVIAEQGDNRGVLSASDVRERVKTAILDGAPIRQVSASFGVSVDEVQAVADSLGVVPSVSASQVSPRQVQAIRERVADLQAGKTTYQDVATSVSTGERVVTAEEVARIAQEPLQAPAGGKGTKAQTSKSKRK